MQNKNSIFIRWKAIRRAVYDSVILCACVPLKVAGLTHVIEPHRRNEQHIRVRPSQLPVTARENEISLDDARYPSRVKMCWRQRHLKQWNGKHFSWEKTDPLFFSNTEQDVNKRTVKVKLCLRKAPSLWRNQTKVRALSRSCANIVTWAPEKNFPHTSFSELILKVKRILVTNNQPSTDNMPKSNQVGIPWRAYRFLRADDPAPTRSRTPHRGLLIHIDVSPSRIPVTNELCYWIYLSRRENC